MIYGKIGPFPPGNVAENVANLRKGKDEVIAMQQKKRDDRHDHPSKT